MVHMSENYDLLSSLLFARKGNSGLASYQYGAENAPASAEGFWCDSIFQLTFSRTFSTKQVTDSSQCFIDISDRVSALASWCHVISLSEPLNAYALIDCDYVVTVY